MEVIVPDEFLSVAIGKRGQNVRLASKLTGWHLDVNSETSYSEAMRSGYDSLTQLDGVGISLADALYEKGYFSAEEVSKASVEELVQIRDIDEEAAVTLIETANNYLAEKAQAEADPEPQASEQLSTDMPSEDSADSDREETEMSDSMQDETLVQDETLAENQKDLQAE
jgi:N utilization substance protein A